MSKTYVIYDKSDMPVMVGSRQEVIKWLGMSSNLFKSELCKLRKGKINFMKRLYKIYVYEFDEEV